MDEKDNKILCELDKNPKITASQLSKKVKVSQQVADYRLKRLVSNKTITKLSAVLNLNALSLLQYRIFITFSAKHYSNEDIFSCLKNKKNVYWAARIGGRYDLLVVICVKDFGAFDEFIDNFIAKFPGLVKDYKCLLVLEHSIYKHKYISKDYSAIHSRYSEKPASIDDLDADILRNLKEDCRVSALSLAKAKSISYKTIINRINSLERNRVILGYRMFINSPDKKPFILLLSFGNYSRSEENSMLVYLQAHETATQVCRMFGLWNLLISVRAQGNEAVQELIIKLRDKFRIIDNYEIIPVFEDISINLWPV